MRMLDLFSGIGGISLAAQWAGIETVAFCEINEYAQKVLNKNFPGVPIHGDIKTLTKETLKQMGVADGSVDIISGGFPCQDVSGAGQKRGLSADGCITRSGLWFEMLRIIQQAQPRWIIGENVAGLLSNNNGKTFEVIINGLVAEGYEVLPILSPASNYGAAFEGKRVFVVAAAASGRYGGCASEKLHQLTRKLVEGEQSGSALWGEIERRLICNIQHQASIPDDIRGDYGLPDWMDRLKCLGNAVVPQQIHPIFKYIVEIERSL